MKSFGLNRFLIVFIAPEDLTGFFYICIILILNMSGINFSIFVIRLKSLDVGKGRRRNLFIFKFEIYNAFNKIIITLKNIVSAMTC